MDIMAVLREHAQIIDEEMLKYLPQKEPRILYDLLRDYPMRGGKKLRPTICIKACEMFGGDGQRAIKTATALELFQNWILIHDDIEDDSDLRRGKPTLHRMYGVPLALNTGDALHMIMWRVLLDNRDVLGDALCYRIMNEFADMMLGTVEGQQIELDWVRRDVWELSTDDYVDLCRRKTALYTIVYPARMGALIAGDTAHLDALIEIGTNWGIAFQIQDDLLNLIGEEQKYGKEIGGDIYEGKRTGMLLHLIQNANEEDKARALEIMRRPRCEKSADDVAWIIRKMNEYGSIEWGRQLAHDYAVRAKELFEKYLNDVPESEAKAFMRALIDFVVEREL